MDELDRAKSEILELVRQDLKKAEKSLERCQARLLDAEKDLQEARELKEQEQRRVDRLRAWLEANQ